MTAINIPIPACILTSLIYNYSSYIHQPDPLLLSTVLSYISIYIYGSYDNIILFIQVVQSFLKYLPTRAKFACSLLDITFKY